MKQMVRNWRELESLHDFIIGKNGKIQVKKDIVDSSGNNIVLVENLKDSHGNKRFVEGDITASTITGVTFTYAKWSLSGTHLMLVLAGEIANGTTLEVGTFGSVELPEYIASKIIPVFATQIVEVKDVKAYYDDWNSKNIQTVLRKTGTNTVDLYMVQNPTFTDVAHFRMQFDLEIDMSYGD